AYDRAGLTGEFELLRTNLSQRLFSIATFVTALVLFSCNVLPASKKPAEQPVERQSNPSAENLDVYLDALNGLSSDDPAHQADVFYSIEREFTRAPTTSNTLRYGLALIMPGHPSTNVTEGKKVIETLLATPERMTPTERALAAIFLRDAT